MSIEQLSDFEPKGAACRAFGVYHPGGFPQRALVDRRARRRRALELSGAVAGRPARRQPDLRRARRADRRAPARERARLGSGPAAGCDDHVRGPRGRAAGRSSTPTSSARSAPRSHAALARARACGSSSATSRSAPATRAPGRRPAPPRRPALQGRFWEMHDALFADQARLEDPHLWDRARALGLDLERFDADRRSEAVREPGQGATSASGVRAGVVTTPTLFVLRPATGGARAVSRLGRAG